MKIYVTGAGGFMGRNFRELAKQDRSEWEIITSHANMIMPKDLTEDVWKAKPDIILNFASQVGPKDSFLYSNRHLAVNLRGTLNLMDAAEYSRVKRFIQISTSEVYGTCRDAKEDAPLHPESPYGMTKASADLALLSAPELEGIVVRPAACYGPYDRPNRMIPMFIENAMKGHKLPIFGSGAQVRNWTYVDDVIHGIFAVIESGVPGEIYHLTAETPHTKLEVAQMVLRYFGRDLGDVNFVPDHSGHPEIQTMDCKRTTKALSWIAPTSFASGLEMTMKDMKAEYECK